ncbi:carbohydrate ABC transporter permease [Enterococcus gallinarum]|uniref:carbohydrate ABC transporter permease n=1 Tax=Enterococcus gallinarum TaxID=1353 RepID=UPI0012E160E2|nr:carbohydrate ABC transporter permease [Enterococcus gallinarum]MCC4044475.1 carbohydrate ABC transporter permease [Enterococcus gallinarum]MUO32037.1 ABC transporter permease subunit [Enterococcus gallinarum]
MTMRKAKYMMYIPLVVIGLISLVPFLWLVRSSFMDSYEIFEFPPKWLPDQLLFSNYADVFQVLDLKTYLVNTFLIIIPCIIGNVFTSCLCGYAFGRLNFKYKNMWFAMVIATMMLPGAVTLIPTFMMWNKLGFVNSFVPLIAPAFFGGGGFNVFLMRQFFAGIPKELDEAAILDGATHWQIFYKIMLPLVKPAMMVVGFFTFMNTWNDFFGPLIYLNDPSKQTLALGLLQLKGQFSSQWNIMMAASTLMTIPALVLFFFGQKYFIQGISLTSGSKG